jgi:hypothetical protein
MLRTLAALFSPVFTTVNDEKNNRDYKNRGMTKRVGSNNVNIITYKNKDYKENI